MGITAVLEDETGTQLATVEDPTNVLHRLLPMAGAGQSNQLLGYIDWYGDTVFNHLQAEPLLGEWDKLTTSSQGSEDLRVLQRIRALIERLRSERHVYLKFYGD